MLVVSERLENSYSRHEGVCRTGEFQGGRQKNRRSFLTRHDGTGHGTDGDVALVSSLRAIDGDGGGEQL